MTKFGKILIAALTSAVILISLCLCLMIANIKREYQKDRYYTVAGYVVGFGKGNHVYVEDLYGELWGVNVDGLEYREYVHLEIFDPGTPESVLDDVIRDVW